MITTQLRTLLASFACAILLGTTVVPQSRRALQQRYGDPVGEVYRTSTNLLIKPSFAPNGILCSASIEAEGRRVKDAELDTILEELAPKDARGKYIIGTFLDYDCLEMNKAGEVSEARDCGGVSEEYERITITKWGNTNDYASAQLTYYRPGCKTKRPHHRK